MSGNSESSSNEEEEDDDEDNVAFIPHIRSSAAGGEKINLSVDQFLQIVGEMGKFQMLVIFISSFLFVLPAHQALYMVFAAVSPPWKCSGNGSVECNTTKIFYEGDSDFNYRCDMKRSSWKYVIEKPSYSIVSEFDLVCSREWLSYLANSALFVGLGLGGPLLGWISDKYGRKKTLFVSFFIECLLAFFISFSPNVSIFIILSILSGIFYSGVSLSNVVLSVELVGPKYRALAGLVVWEMYSIAGCLVSLQAYYVPDWRDLTKIISIPYIVFALGYFFVPESLRWQRSKNKLKEAEKTLRRVARINKRTYPEHASLEPVNKAEFENSGSFRDLFTSWCIVLQMIIVSFMWFTVNTLYYGLTLAFSGFGGNIYRDYVLMIAPEIVMNIASIFFSDRFGRKTSALFGFVLSAIGVISVGFLTAFDIKINVVNITIGVFVKIFSLLAWCALEIWSTELFPTCVRSKAMGIFYVNAQIGSASAPWIAEALLRFHASVPFFVLGIIPVIAFLLGLMIPETKGKIMEDFVRNSHEEIERKPLIAKNQKKGS